MIAGPLSPIFFLLFNVGRAFSSKIGLYSNFPCQKLHESRINQTILCPQKQLRLSIAGSRPALFPIMNSCGSCLRHDHDVRKTGKHTHAMICTHYVGKGLLVGVDIRASAIVWNLPHASPHLLPNHTLRLAFDTTLGSDEQPPPAIND